MSRGHVLLVAALVVIAGCGGSVQETSTTPTATTTVETTTASPSSPTTTTPTPTTTETTETTTTATTTESTWTPTPTSPDNPWEQEEVQVAISNESNHSRNFQPLVTETLAYWNGNASEYGDYAVNFSYTTDATDADIEIEFVERIWFCGEGTDDTTVGCASMLEKYDEAEETETVKIVRGYSNASTVRILEHEFGHLLGLDHGDEPMPLMAALTEHTYLSKPDISERAVPWSNSTLSVAVDDSNVTAHDKDEVREQIEHALNYYEKGAEDHVSENISFVRTDNETAADIVVTFPDDSISCNGEPLREGSCGTSWAYDTDTDEAYEYYSEWQISILDVDEEAVGWHVGYWLTSAFGLQSEEELPPPFVDADYDDRRNEWWE